MSSLDVDATVLPPPTDMAMTLDSMPTSRAAAATRGGVAFEEIYHRFASTVHGLILACVGTEEAEDLTQETFLAVYRRLGSLRDAKALPKWICTVARNTATDHLRRRMRRPAHDTVEELPLAASDQGEGGPELRARVLAGIRRLPDAYRETLVLRLVEGLSGPQIAERTGLKPRSVRVNLCRGMAMLRPMLRKEGWS